MDGLSNDVSTHRLQSVERLQTVCLTWGFTNAPPLMKAEPRLAGEPTRAPLRFRGIHVLANLK
jgi:hypothetical protein